jgi:hypothetical protein
LLSTLRQEQPHRIPVDRIFANERHRGYASLLTTWEFNHSKIGLDVRAGPNDPKVHEDFSLVDCS